MKATIHKLTPAEKNILIDLLRAKINAQIDPYSNLPTPKSVQVMLSIIVKLGGSL